MKITLFKNSKQKEGMSGIHPQQQQQQPHVPPSSSQTQPLVISVDKLWNVGLTVLLLVAFVVLLPITIRAFSRYIEFRWNKYLESRGGSRDDRVDEEKEEEEEVEEVVVKRKKRVPATKSRK